MASLFLGRRHATQGACDRGAAPEPPRGQGPAAAAYAEMSRGRQTKGGVVEVDAYGFVSIWSGILT